MPVYRLEDSEPVIDPSVFIANNASIIGEVKIGKNSSVWFKTRCPEGRLTGWVSVSVLPSLAVTVNRTVMI